MRKKIAKRAKKTPKAFYKYVNGKIKTKDSVGVLDSENREKLSQTKKNPFVEQLFLQCIQVAQKVSHYQMIKKSL